MTKDPVCLMDVDEDTALATAQYQGRTYYFCSHMCQDRFIKEFDKGRFIAQFEDAIAKMKKQ